MASQRKIKIQKERLLKKQKIKEKLKEQRHRGAEERKAGSKARRTVKEFLDFNGILSKLKPKKLVTINPCKEIPIAGEYLGWNGADWNGVQW